MIQRFSPLTLLLPLMAGCCCCGMGGSSGPTAEELAATTAVEAEGLGAVNISVGSEPYSLESEGLSSGEMSGSTLKLSLFGEQTVSLPQLSSVTAAGANDITVNGVDTDSFTAKVTSDLGSVMRFTSRPRRSGSPFRENRAAGESDWLDGSRHPGPIR